MPVRSRGRAAATLVASVSLLLVPEAHGAETSGVVAVAHRGASGSAPENTLSAISQAVAARADLVEIDVRLTKDGVPVLMHDATLARTTDVEKVFPARSPWRVEDLTLAETRRLDAGSWKSATYAKETVPTLEDAVEQLSLSPAGAVLEVKHPGFYGGVDGIGAKVYDVVRRKWPDALTASEPRRLLVASSDEAFVEEFAARYPEVGVSVIAKTRPSETVASYADHVDVRHDEVTPELAGEMSSAGLTVGAWTVDDTDTMRQLSAHVDSITTNRPLLLRSALEAQGRLYTGTRWPARETAKPSWRMTTSGRYLNRRVAVHGYLTTAAGTPGRWQRAAVQRRVDGSWRTILERATDASGWFSTSVAGRRGLRIRVVSLDDWQFPTSASPAKDLALSKVGTSVRLTGPRAIRVRDRATLSVRWRTSDNSAVNGKARLFRYSGGAWRYMREVRVSNGYAKTRVRPRRTTRYQIRGRAGWWYSPAADGRRVLVRR
jgi:glycerophosphoryl diester phosphodiesterase